MKSQLLPEFLIERNEDRCIRCGVCVRQCGFEVHRHDEELDLMFVKEEDCAGCQRCAVLCPTNALIIRPNPADYRPNASWTKEVINNLKKQAETGGVLLTGCGNPQPYKIYFDHLLINASQVTNPSIDPLREPMELRIYLGKKPEGLSYKNGVLEYEETEQVRIETPIIFSAISFGAISFQAQKALAQAATEFGTLFNTGEGGLPLELRKYGNNAIVQCASGRFGVDSDYLNTSRIVEIKIGQGAKPGIGGHLPGEKVSVTVSQTRMIPEGTDALSPAPQHDIYSIEDLSTLIYALKEATNYKPISVKIAAVHNAAAIASGIVRAGADIVAIDGFRGGTGAAPQIIRDNVGVPIELALASVDDRLRAEGIRNQCSLICAGGFRNSADIVKAIALGADAVYIGTAALVAMGCTVCQRCYTGKCNWGICTQDPYLAKRLNPDIARRRLLNLLKAWSLEVKEMLGGMGINALESLRGNRLHLRGIDLADWELKVLGVKGAGQ
ncbi:glutamate synthase-related protein [Candidatus Borrarchaeum sp.]|uniref:glutamate synthase-related protein n=1 Tax=Candidatus Borrarchaeum sp. TaxID=2846742 RepID=UPI002580F556|nr:glutamate synthase-related protein [Candidatus Borrarchaeum sp.]